MLEHEGRESERGADGEQVHQDRRERDHEAPEHDEQQQERDDEDEADGVRGASDEHRGEVAVLRGGAADLRGRHRARKAGTQRVHECRGARVVDGGRARDAHDDATRRRRRGDDACVDDSGDRGRDPRHRGGVSGGRCDECGCGGAGTERADEHVVAVAAGVAFVDDLRAGHAEMHAECGDDERADHDQTERQHGGRPAQRDTGPALPPGLGGDVGVIGVLAHEDAIAERNEQRRQEGERRERDRDDRQDHAERHRPEHHDRHEEHGGQRHDDGQGREEHGLARGRHRVLDRGEGVFAFDAFFSVAADDEQAVVDADCEADHHGEVHGPHRHRHEPTEHVQEREARRRCRPTRGSAADPAASSMPNATNSRIRVGRPLTSSALCSASALILLKSLHTGHSPVTLAFAPDASVSFPT